MIISSIIWVKQTKETNEKAKNYYVVITYPMG